MRELSERMNSKFEKFSGFGGGGGEKEEVQAKVVNFHNFFLMEPSHL